MPPSPLPLSKQVRSVQPLTFRPKRNPPDFDSLMFLRTEESLTAVQANHFVRKVCFGSRIQLISCFTVPLRFKQNVTTSPLHLFAQSSTGTKVNSKRANPLHCFEATNQPFQLRVMVKSSANLPKVLLIYQLPPPTNITQPMDCVHPNFNKRSVRSLRSCVTRFIEIRSLARSFKPKA